MPGILIMDYSGSDAPPALRDGENKKRDHDGRLVNGGHDGKLVNGDQNNAPRDTINGASLAVTAVDSQSPPEIPHIPEDVYNPLSTLLTRISQECYSDLGDVLTKMADLPLAPSTNGAITNGLGARASANDQENAEVNKRKKLLLLKFAQDNRSKFIKLLVLTEWGKKAAVDVAKLIDLYQWTREQSEHMEYVDAQLQRIKIHSNMARENNPDINTALEILSTGKASWMPSLGYITPEPISSEKALKLLRYMNTSLSIRLTVHETLPRHLRNWRIHSGRATFIVPDEFEFDVVSFVEDASEQWSFIDLRLLFSPAPSITVGSPFFMRLKMQADFVLRENGLVGLFDFLYNFILTHKISVLRSQAIALLRSGWVGSLKVEPVHRELVEQYWINRPGKKSWIDIGVAHNRPKNGKISWRGQPLPALKVRWFREGKEVEKPKLEFDWKDLSMERITKCVIASHINSILRSTRENLNSRLVVHLNLSKTEPADSTIKVTLGPRSNTVTLSVEPVTGHYILRPATAITARAETAFNQGREPAQIANILTQVLAQMLLGSIQRVSQQLGWQSVARQSLHAQAIKAAVKLDILQYALYSPRGWASNWAFAAVIDSSGESWWVLRIGSNGSTIEYAEQLKMDRPGESSLSIERTTLASLERVAVQLLSFRVTAQQLEKESKSCSLRYEFGLASASAEAQRMARRWVLYVQTPDLLVTKTGEQPWLKSNIAITCEGLRAGGQNIWHIATGRMVKAATADMQKLMAASPPSSFSFSEDGRFRILLSTPFGRDILGELRARLRDVNRLRAFATTLQKRKMRLGSSSLQRVQFEYGPLPSSAAVKFSVEKEFTIELSPKNPHYRLLDLLTDIANDRSPASLTMDPTDANGLDRFCTTLMLTRSILKVLQELVDHAPGNVSNPALHVHSVFSYRLTYDNPVCTFDMRLQPKDDKVYWFIEDNIRTHGQDTRPTPERGQGHRRLEILQAKLKTLFSNKGTGWFGTRNGIVADLDAVPDALRKLDECVLSCKMEGGYKAPPSLEQPAASAQTQSNPAQHPGQQARMQQQQQQQARMQQQQQQHAQGQPRRQGQPQNQQNQRAQPPGSRQQQQQLQQQQGRGGGQNNRPGQSRQDVIEID